MRYNRPTLGKADIDKHVNQPHGTRNDREKQLKNKHRLAYRRQGGSHEGEKKRFYRVGSICGTDGFKVLSRE